MKQRGTRRHRRQGATSPGSGFKDATTGQYCGFDIEIARLVAAKLGFGPDKIDYKVVPSAAREDAIERGEIDYYVGTYTINDNRKQRVSFAGPVLRGRAEPAGAQRRDRDHRARTPSRARRSAR